jgi:hypothetical protein
MRECDPGWRMGQLAAIFRVFRRGSLPASAPIMAGAKKFEELICWQLADELKVRAFRIMSQPAARRDRDFCRELRESARSAPALIADGFGRWTNPEFRHSRRFISGAISDHRTAAVARASSQFG